MVAFKTSYGVIQQSLFYSTVYSNPEVDCLATNLQRANELRRTTSSSAQAVQPAVVTTQTAHLEPGAGAPTCRRRARRPDCWVCRRRPPVTPSAACTSRCATASSWWPTTTNPTLRSPAGTLLVRGPYGRAFPFSLVFARLYAARGYHVVLQSVRGTFGSGGEFEPMVNEAADGADTVAWLREQPWFTGRFATIGVSYLGFTQWALLQDPPPELAAAVITAGPHDLLASAWGTGSFAVNDFLGWSDLVAHQEDPGASGPGSGSCGPPAGWRARPAEVPLGDGRPGAARRGGAVVRVLGRARRPRRSVLGPAAASPPRWTGSRCRCCCSAAGKTCSCARRCSSTGTCAERGVDVALTMGPWTHTQLLTKGLATSAAQNTGLAGRPPGRRAGTARPAAVRVFVNGQGWRKLPDWPPATTEHALYLRPGGRLGETAPGARGRLGDLPLRPRRPDTHHRRSAAVPQRRLPRRQPARASARRARLHRRRPHRTICASTATRSSSWRTARTIRTSTCSSGSARSTPRAGPATSATATGGWGPRQEDRQHRARRHRPPVPRRLTHPRADRRQLVPPLRPQPRHRRGGADRRGS